MEEKIGNSGKSRSLIVVNRPAKSLCVPSKTPELYRDFKTPLKMKNWNWLVNIRSLENQKLLVKQAGEYNEK